MKTHLYVDNYAELKIRAEALEEQLKTLKALIINSAPTEGEPTEKGWKLNGEDFGVTITIQSRNTLDEKLLAEKFGLSAAQVESCKRQSFFDVIRYKAI